MLVLFCETRTSDRLFLLQNKEFWWIGGTEFTAGIQDDADAVVLGKELLDSGVHLGELVIF